MCAEVTARQDSWNDCVDQQLACDVCKHDDVNSLPLQCRCWLS